MNKNVRGLWAAYGRSKEALKRYGEVDTSPLYFMRMQIIVQYASVGLWLMPGKSNAGRFDREYFLKQIENDKYLEDFFELLTDLGNAYWIEIAGEIKYVTTFTTKESLRDFLRQDNWRYYYFTIGRDFDLGSPELLSINITNTIITNFTLFYPLYELIKDKF